MLKNLVQYEQDDMSAKFKVIYCQLLASLLDVCGATRKYCESINGIRIQMGMQNKSEMATVLGALCMTSLCNSNQ
jgi:hypothetical protein